MTGLTCTTCKVHDMWTGKGMNSEPAHNNLLPLMVMFTRFGHIYHELHFDGRYARYGRAAPHLMYQSSNVLRIAGAYKLETSCILFSAIQ